MLGVSWVAHGSEPPVSVQFDRFSRKLAQAEPEQAIRQEQLHAFPDLLLNPDSQYPQLHEYEWADIQRLAQIRQTCQKPSDIKSRKRGLSRAIEFEWALCHGEQLPESWWSQEDLLHPAGGSYGDRYLDALVEQGGEDSEAVRAFLRNHRDTLTLGNPYHSLYTTLASLDERGLSALQQGYGFILARDRSLWVSYQDKVVQYAPSTWQALANHYQLRISYRKPEQFCPVFYGNLCVREKSTPAYLGWGLALFFSLIALFAVIKTIWERRQAIKEKKFILQLLTHELRTPVASLNMTVDQFRAEYDQLSEAGQDAFARLLQDSSRLHRLTETSKGYLSNDRQAMLVSQPALLSEWLEEVMENYPVRYQLSSDKELSLPWYWLGLCLDNLIRNALMHGQPPVSLAVKSEPVLSLQVSDQGQHSGLLARCLKKKSPRQGMGIGLILVKRIMKRLGGRLVCQKNPTRYRLELDYEKTAAGGR